MCSTKGTPLSRFVLVLINTCFVVAGSLAIAYAIKLNNSGWLDVFEEDLPWIKATLFGCTIALGCVAISIAAIGCIGASFKKKGLLCCYNIFASLAFVFITLVMVGAFTSMALANDWAGKGYPAAQQEPFIADNFNQVYCYAQGAYLCTAAPVSDVLGLLIPGQEIPKSISSLIGGYEGLNDFCDDERANFLGSLLSDEVKNTLISACRECEEVEKYETVYSWVDEQCPLTTDTMAWCGGFLFEGEKGDTYDGAPYEACRPEFLSLWSKASRGIGLGMVAFLVFLLVVIISSCAMIRHRARVQVEAPKEEAKKGGDEEQQQIQQQQQEQQQQQQQPAQPYVATVY